MKLLATAALDKTYHPSFLFMSAPDLSLTWLSSWSEVHVASILFLSLWGVWEREWRYLEKKMLLLGAVWRAAMTCFDYSVQCFWLPCEGCVVF